MHMSIDSGQKRQAEVTRTDGQNSQVALTQRLDADCCLHAVSDPSLRPVTRL